MAIQFITVGTATPTVSTAFSLPQADRGEPYVVFYLPY